MSWSIWDSEETRSNKFYPIEILHDQEKYVVANVADEADANLIAAAPDLLEALEDIARGDYSDPLCMKTPEERAREAIAKARGQV